jgi:hypothetical protein
MTLLLKHGGAQKAPMAGWGKVDGVWRPFVAVDRFSAGAWFKEYSAERVVTITANAAQINAQNYFTHSDWANANLRKKLIVGAGVHIWSYTPGIPALNVGLGRGNILTIENNGYILGAGGYSNSGVGGEALYVGQGGVHLVNNGGIYGGGGGGGVGGQGGPGYYQTSRQVREPASGDYYGGGYGWTYYAAAGLEVGTWAGAQVANNTTYSYWYGSFRGAGGGGDEYYGIYRTYNSTQTYYTNGGAGGAGGRGTGYSSSLANVYQDGSNSAGGGTNAGAGGKGGNGGGWGASGASGNTGATGNNGSGSGGAAGGLAGRYINGAANIESLINNGTLLGRVA